MLEIFQRVQAGRSSTRLLVYRLPVPESRSVEVTRIIEHYAASRTAVRTLGRRVAVIALIFAMALLGVALAIAA